MTGGLLSMALLALALDARAADTADTGGCDHDGDGFNAPFCGGEDCNDGDAATYPGATEIPDDGLDQDCDGYDAATVVMVGGGRGCATAPGGGSMWVIVGVALALAGRRTRRLGAATLLGCTVARAGDVNDDFYRARAAYATAPQLSLDFVVTTWGPDGTQTRQPGVVRRDGDRYCTRYEDTEVLRDDDELILVQHDRREIHVFQADRVGATSTTTANPPGLSSGAFSPIRTDRPDERCYRIDDPPAPMTWMNVCFGAQEPWVRRLSYGVSDAPDGVPNGAPRVEIVYTHAGAEVDASERCFQRARLLSADGLSPGSETRGYRVLREAP